MKSIHQHNLGLRKILWGTAVFLIVAALVPVTAMSEQTKSNTKKRVAIITDTTMHIGPYLARELARRNHNLVIGTPAKGLAEELRQMGAEVEVVTGIKDLSKPGAVKKLVRAAQKRFGGFDAAFIRPGKHLTGNILQSTKKDWQASYEGNMLSVVYALQALLPPLIEAGKGGQVLIETSATGARPFEGAVAYSATRAGANMIIRSSALTVAKYGITVNGMGTNFMNYPGFRDSVGADNPKALEKINSIIPLGRLGEPKEAAHLAAALLDGKNNYVTAEFFSVSGGWGGQ